MPEALDMADLRSGVTARGAGAAGARGVDIERARREVR
jgi:hypothetical protein